MHLIPSGGRGRHLCAINRWQVVDTVQYCRSVSNLACRGFARYLKLFRSCARLLSQTCSVTLLFDHSDGVGEMVQKNLAGSGIFVLLLGRRSQHGALPWLWMDGWLSGWMAGEGWRWDGWMAGWMDVHSPLISSMQRDSTPIAVP